MRMKVCSHLTDATAHRSSGSSNSLDSAEYYGDFDTSSSLQAQRTEPLAKNSSEYVKETFPFLQRLMNHYCADDGSDFTDDFCILIQKYAETTQISQCASPFNIRGAHSWDEVAQVANLAQEKYLKDAKGPKGSIRRFFRVTGDNAHVINLWVNLLPNDQYFSVLCGGLKLILGVAARRSEQREDILETFKKVPETVLRTQRYHELIPSDKVLRNCAFALYLALLEMIIGMIRSLVGKSLLTKIKDGFTGSLSDRPLNEIKKRYRKSEHDLQERLDYLRMSLDVSTNAAVGRMEPTVIRTNHTVSETYSLAQGMAAQTADIHTRVDKIGEEFDGIRSHMASQLEANYTIKQIEEHTKATNEMVSLLRQELRSVEWRSFQQTFRSQSDVRNLRLLGEHRSDFQPAAPNRWLRELLAINLDTITRDLEFMGRQGQHINSLSQVQSRQLLSNPRFHHWIGSNKSDVLLIDGNSELSRCSPMSSLCAALISGLAHQKRSQIVYFFCGAHCTSSDPIGGPAGLVRCLIAQLLDFREFDIDFIRFSLGSEQLQQNNLTVWCGILRELVTQLSDTVVFCVMDGVSFFEAEPWRSQMQELMRSLTLLAGDGVLGAVFKLLVTSPGASKDAKAVIPPKCFIQILEDGVEDEVVALTDRNMPREIYQTSLPRLMGYSNRFLVHNSDAIEDADNIFEHGCE